MGVPAFFTWLKEKYPNIIFNLCKNKKFQCDYFYLDMNGIIHPCCHPEDEDDMLLFMKKYVDMLLEYVNPSQLLYIAIDGPPPRAKMMQQRERRFIKDYESRMKQATAVDGGPKGEEWDSNQITPGTRFMTKVAKTLADYIKQKLQAASNSGSKLKWILSDGSVPGEGEHKILDFIRTIRYRGDYKPDAKHVLFSNDADMIFLTLLLHEQKAYVMRDVPIARGKAAKLTLWDTRFCAVNLTQLTNYLKVDFSADKMGFTNFQYDINRIIDDVVFLGYFVGNDFIPHLPFMNMRDGAYQYLLQKYVFVAPQLPSYLVSGADINFKALSIYLAELAKEEKPLLKHRMGAWLGMMQDRHGVNSDATLNENFDRGVRGGRGRGRGRGGHNAAKRRKLNDGTAVDGSDGAGGVEENVLDGRVLAKSNVKQFNGLKFGEDGYKDRYYKAKFGVKSYEDSFAKDLVSEYVRALSWIQHYYYGGPVSWTWFYPEHYAPMVSDLANLDSKLNSKKLWKGQEKGAPLTPLTQLSLLMPENSARITLPSKYYKTIFGHKSKIKHFYPESFSMDLNSKLMDWEAIALMPHVDVEMIIAQLNRKRHKLNEEELKLDTFGHHELFFSEKHGDFKDKVSDYWGCTVLTGNKGNGVWRVHIEIPNTLEMCRTPRKRDGFAEETGLAANVGKINEMDLKKVSQCMYRFFMAGKVVPRDIIRFLRGKHNEHLWETAIEELRKSKRSFIFKRRFGGRGGFRGRGRGVGFRGRGRGRGRGRFGNNFGQISDRFVKSREDAEQSEETGSNQKTSDDTTVTDKKKEKNSKHSKKKKKKSLSFQLTGNGESSSIVEKVLEAVQRNKERKRKEKQHQMDSLLSSVMNGGSKGNTIDLTGDSDNEKRNGKKNEIKIHVKTSGAMKKKKLKRLKNIKRILTSGSVGDDGESVQKKDEAHAETRKQHRQKSKRERLKQILKGSDRSQRKEEMVIRIPSSSKSKKKKKETKSVNAEKSQDRHNWALAELEAEIKKNIKKQKRERKEKKSKKKRSKSKQ